MLEELRKFKEATLIIGNIATKPSWYYDALKKPEDITEKMVLLNRAGDKAVQYVFNPDEGDDFLDKHAKLSLRTIPYIAPSNT